MDELRSRSVNYDESQAPPHVTRGWHEDVWRAELGREEPGEPAADGLVTRAIALLDAYDFVDPHILRAAFRHDDDLVGRDMLLEGRFLNLRFAMGVRITARLDELRDGADGPERVTGWAYQTLHGHLEEGLLNYEVVKNLGSGRVEFRIDAHSRRAPMRNPVLALGFRLFGRRRQLRFYRHALRRLTELVPAPSSPTREEADGLVHAPSSSTGVGDSAPWVIRFTHPGA